MGLLIRIYQERLLYVLVHVDPKRCQRARLKKIKTESERNLTLFNIQSSDKLEIFFGGRVFSAAKDAILFTTAKVAKAFCIGQRH